MTTYTPHAPRRAVMNSFAVASNAAGSSNGGPVYNLGSCRNDDPHAGDHHTAARSTIERAMDSEEGVTVGDVASSLSFSLATAVEAHI